MKKHVFIEEAGIITMQIQMSRIPERTGQEVDKEKVAQQQLVEVQRSYQQGGKEIGQLRTPALLSPSSKYH